MRLYGKDGIKRRLDSAAAKNRLSHAILFSGSEGSGRKLLARYAAQLFLCENNACGKCADCRNIENDGHPDVIFVKRQCGGKYAMEPLRAVLRDTVVKPNNGDLKVYVFEDCDFMTAQHQNALLKLIEEPAPHLRFVFTCENTGVIPETVLSRVTIYDVPDTSVEDCAKCLFESGKAESEKQARELAETFSGNIGRCLAVLDKDEQSSEARLVETAKRAAAAIGKRSGFGTAAALSEQSGRAEFARAVEYLSRILRDALAVRCGCEAEFFGKKEAEIIASEFSEGEILNMLDAAFEIAENEIYNLNLALTAVYFTSKIL